MRTLDSIVNTLAHQHCWRDSILLSDLKEASANQGNPVLEIADGTLENGP